MRFLPSFSGSLEEGGRDRQLVTGTVLWAVGIGCVFASVIGGISAIWWGAASFGAGVFIGFLFGIPRVLQDDAPSGGTDEAESRVTQRVNTNLEQISDWLTKIIVGFGLIELRKVPAAFQSLATFVATDSESSPAIAGSLILYFAVTGFFAGYLLTRLFLALAFSRADNAKTGQPMSLKPGEVAKIIRNAEGVNAESIALAQTSEARQSSRCALVVVDIQNDFFADGALPIGGAESLIAPMNQTIRLAEAAGMLIIYTQDWHPSNHSSFEDNGGSWPTHCVISTGGADLNGGLYRAHSSVNVKFGTDAESDGYSPFENPLMDHLLSSPSISRIYVAGIALEYCVLATISQSVKRNKKVTAIRNVIRAAAPADSVKIWKQLEVMNVDVIDALTEEELANNCVNRSGESGELEMNA